MLSDIVIAQAAKMLPIAKVAEKLGLTDEDLIPYGRYKAKITAQATDGSNKKATFTIKIMKGVVKKIKITGSKTVKQEKH